MGRDTGLQGKAPEQGLAEGVDGQDLEPAGGVQHGGEQAARAVAQGGVRLVATQGRERRRGANDLGDGSSGRDRLCTALKDLDEPYRPWATWGKKDGGLSANTLRKALKEYGVKTVEVWDPGQKVRGYRWDDFFEARERYLDA